MGIVILGVPSESPSFSTQETPLLSTGPVTWSDSVLTSRSYLRYRGRRPVCKHQKRTGELVSTSDDNLGKDQVSILNRY